MRGEVGGVRGAGEASATNRRWAARDSSSGAGMVSKLTAGLVSSSSRARTVARGRPPRYEAVAPGAPVGSGSTPTTCRTLVGSTKTVTRSSPGKSHS